MTDFEPIDVRFLINNEEFKADANRVKSDITGVDATAAKSSQKVSETIKRVYDSSTKEVNEYTAAVTQSSAAINAQGKLVRSQKPKWDGLGNSINQISREMPAFAVSAQTGILALSNNIPILADEIARLKVENQALVASGQKAIPVWKRIASSMLSWNTLLSVGVTLATIYGREIGNFIKGLSKGKSAIDAVKKSQEALNKSFESTDYKNAIQSVTELKNQMELAKSGMIDADDVVKNYNDSLGETAGNAQNLAEVEQLLIDKGDAYIEMMLYKTAATAAAAEAATILAEQQKKITKAEDNLDAYKKNQSSVIVNPSLIGDSAQSEANASFLKAINKQTSIDVDNLNADLEGQKTAFQKTINSLLKKAADIAQKNKLDLYGDSAQSSSKSLVSGRQKLLDRIAAIDKEYARKSYTRDEEEIQALKDKFDKIRQLVLRFNKDPKNKAKAISLNGLEATEDRALSDLSYRQETDLLAKELREQKRLFVTFENYKKTFGEQAAKERFEKDLKGFKTYSDYVKNTLNNNSKAEGKITQGTATGGELERIELLRKAAETEIQLDKKRLDELLAQLVGYHQQKALIEEQYQADLLSLKANFNGQELEEKVSSLEAIKEAELNSLYDSNLKKMAAYKDITEGVEKLTVAAAKKVINNAKVMLGALLKTGEVSEEAIKDLETKIHEAEDALDDRTLERMQKVAASLSSLGSALADFGENVNNASLQEVGGFLSGLAGGVDGLLVAFDDSASSGDKISAGIEGLITLIDIVGSSAKKRKEAEEAYYRSVIGFQHDYNLGLAEQIRLQSIMSESVFIKDYEGRLHDGVDALKEANEKYLEAVAKLDEGRAKVGQRDAIDWNNVGKGAAAGAAAGAAIGSIVPVIGTVIGGVVGAVGGAIVGFFGGKKKKNEYTSLLEEYPELVSQTADGLIHVNRVLAESLIANNLVDDATKQILQNILDWEDAIEAAREQIKEVITELTGSLSSDLKNSLVEAFKNGEDAAESMGETVEQVLENIIGNILFSRIFSDAFTSLEEQMAASYDVGGDGNWTDDFSRFFSNASALTDDFNEAMAAAQAEAANFGFDIFEPDGSGSTGLQGAIQREMTEATASELTGLFRAQFDVTKRNYILDEQRFELDKRCCEHTMSIMRTNAAIASNTATTVLRLDEALVELRKLSKKNKDSGSYDRGF